jgi:hypothetical protein
MRDHAMPSARSDMGHEVARVVAIGATLQAVEQHDDGPVGPTVDPVEVKEVAVRQFQTLASVSDRGDVNEQAGVDGLQVPTGQPGGSAISRNFRGMPCAEWSKAAHAEYQCSTTGGVRAAGVPPTWSGEA